MSGGVRGRRQKPSPTRSKEGRSIILASHNREDIQILCDQVYEMDNGKIIG